MSRRDIDIELPPDQALRAIEHAAGHWGAEWQADGWGGRLTLPVTAGLRHGRLSGRVGISSRGGGSRLELEIEREEFWLNRGAVFVLLCGAIGGISVMLWPVWPPLLALAPVGAVLAILAWLMVASRLHSSGVDDFFALVASDPEAPEPAA